MDKTQIWTVIAGLVAVYGAVLSTFTAWSNHREKMPRVKVKVSYAMPAYGLHLGPDFSLGKGEAEAIGLALNEKAQLLAIDDKNGINACKLLGIAFTTAVGILIRSREKGLLEGRDALAKLEQLARYGRNKNSIIEDARLKLEAEP